MIQGLEEPIITRDGMETLSRSGPLFLTRHFFDLVGEASMNDMVFPSSYFSPLPNFMPRTSGDAARREYAREWSMAIHYWQTSWLKPNPVRAFLGRVKRSLRA
jgi:hypothetical protein